MEVIICLTGEFNAHDSSYREKSGKSAKHAPRGYSARLITFRRARTRDGRPKECLLRIVSAKL